MDFFDENGIEYEKGVNYTLHRTHKMRFFKALRELGFVEKTCDGGIKYFLCKKVINTKLDIDFKKEDSDA